MTRSLAGTFFAALVYWAGWAGLAPADALALAIDPSKIRLEIPPGERRGAVIKVLNQPSSQPAVVTIYASDLDVDASGKQTFPDVGTTPLSCAKWIKLDIDTVTIPANGAVEVRFSVLAPEDAEGARFAMLFFETGGPSTGVSGAGMSYRIGAIIEVVVSGTEKPSAKLSHFEFRQPKTFKLEIQNDGNVALAPTGTITIYAGQQRLTEASLNAEQARVLPQHARTFEVVLQQPLAPGSYRARALVDYGVKQLLAGELADITVK